MTMYYSHARKQQKRAAQGMVLEAILARGAPTGAGGNEAVMIVDRELVYNDRLAAQRGRLTQR